MTGSLASLSGSYNCSSRKSSTMLALISVFVSVFAIVRIVLVALQYCKSRGQYY